MIVIISPAKKMNIDESGYSSVNTPRFLNEAKCLLGQLKQLNYESLKTLWCCNDKIAMSNYERLAVMDLDRPLAPALFAYEGIQYKYMAPHVFDNNQLDYVAKHLKIISGLYGLLRPFDGVVPYRLEMQAKLSFMPYESLYQFWGDKLAKQLAQETDVILNLASKEYSQCVLTSLPKGVKFINCIFGEMINGKIIEKGTLCKMARGEMVRFMAENQIEHLCGIKAFDRLGYTYATALSDDENFIFLKESVKQS